MKRFNFDRYYGGCKMAEGVAVHGETIEEATAIAEGIAQRAYRAGEYRAGWRLQFRDNQPCFRWRCYVCDKAREVSDEQT